MNRPQEGDRKGGGRAEVLPPNLAALEASPASSPHERPSPFSGPAPTGQGPEVPPIVSFWFELKRRKVVRVAVAYVIVGIATSGAADIFLPNLGAPGWVLPTVLVLLILGLPVSLVLAWAYEVTPEGVVRETAGGGPVSTAQPVADPTHEPHGQTPMAAPLTAETTQPPPVHNSIAVLPFADMSPEGDQEYFGDGIAEELINALVKVPDFRVAARTSSFQFKGDNRSMQDIGGELKVATVLEGSVRKAGDRLRITAQLITVEDGYHLWSESYDRTMDDIFAVQEELARSIVDACQATLVDEHDVMVEALTHSTEAYDLYLKARHMWANRHEVGVQGAIEYFEKAAKCDPDYALPYAGLSDSYAVQGYYGVIRGTEAEALARPNLERAIELRPDLPEVHVSRGMFQLFFAGDVQLSKASFERALELKPGFGFAQAWHSVTCALLGQTDESLESARIARESEPDSAYVQTIAWSAVGIYARHPEEAAEAMVRLRSVFPGNGFVAQQSTMVLAMSDRWEEALLAAEESLARGPDEPLLLAIYAWMLKGNGRAKEADQISDRLDALSRDRFVAFTTRMMALFGDRDTHHREAHREAIVRLLGQALEDNDPLMQVIVQMSGLDPYRTDPRVDAVIRGLGLTAWTAEAMTERFGMTFDPPPES